jgi:hypothetical protein
LCITRSADVVDQIDRLIHPVAVAQDGEELVHRHRRFVEPRGDGGNRPESPGRRDINRVGFAIGVAVAPVKARPLYRFRRYSIFMCRSVARTEPGVMAAS